MTAEGKEERKEKKKKKKTTPPFCSLPSWALALPYPSPLLPFSLSLKNVTTCPFSSAPAARRLENLIAVVGT